MSDDTIFTEIAVWRAEFPFRLTFSHNLASRDRAETLVVEVTTSKGGKGYGQALPRDYLTGENLDTALEDIKTVWWPKLKGKGVREHEALPQFLEVMRPLYQEADDLRRTASYAAVDVAACMATAATAGAGFFPVAEGALMPLVGVVSGGSAKAAGCLARIFRRLGFTRIKVKVGKDADADALRLEAVRRAAGPGVWLAVDANAAWTRNEAVSRMRELRRWNVALVEEPLDKDAAVGVDYRAMEHETGVSVMADESLCTLSDALKLVAAGRPSWWNLRLAKNGGFSGVAALSRLADAHGAKKYGGILVGETSAMGMAAVRGFFLTQAVCGECGFSRILLRGDPFRGAPGGFRGEYRNPGAGDEKNAISFNEGILLKHAKAVWRDRD